MDLDFYHNEFINRIGLPYKESKNDHMIEPIINDAGILISFRYRDNIPDYYILKPLQDTNHWIKCNYLEKYYDEEPVIVKYLCCITRIKYINRPKYRKLNPHIKELNDRLIGTKYTDKDSIFAIFRECYISVSEINIVNINKGYYSSREISTGRFILYVNDNNYIYQIKNE